MKKRWLLRLALLVLLAFVWMPGAVPAVQAHAGLERSDPPNNAFLSESPRQVRMWFSEAVAIHFSSVHLLDIDGRAVEGVSLAADPANPRLLTASLPALGKGLYSLSWIVLSSADGHQTEGLIVFGVGLQPGESSAAVAAPPQGPDWRSAGARGLSDLAVCGLFGIWAIATALLFSGEEDSFRVARARALTWATGLAGLALAAGFIQLALQPGVSTLGALLSSTRWGQAWLMRQALLAGLLGAGMALRASFLQSARRTWWAAGTATAGLVLASLAFGTHEAYPALPALSLLTSLLHLLAASLWVGGLAGLLFVTAASRASVMAAGLWASFGRYAVLAVSLTVATGLLNASGLVLSSNGLVSAPYGQLLTGKLGLVLLVGLGGLLNSLTLHPALARPAARAIGRGEGQSLFSLQRLAWGIPLEGCLGLGVILLAGALASTPPINGIAYRYASLEQMASLTAVQEDLVLTMAIQPNQPGPNIIDLVVTSTLKPPPAEITRVILRMTYQPEAMGTQSADAALIAPNTYRLGGGNLSLPGPWKLEVVVRRKGIPDVVFPYDWNVLPVGHQPGSFQLQPFLAGAALIFFLVAVFAGVGLFSRKKLFLP